MAHIVQCRICKQKFDIDKIDKDKWTKPTNNQYYHTDCYNDWKNADNHTDSDWVALIYDFIARDLKVSYDYFMCEAQRKRFIKQNHCTNKGIYFTLKYFYEKKQGDWSKGNGGIGIVPYVYNDAREYWTALERQKQGTMNEIERQIRERSLRPVKEIVKKEKKKTPKWSLDDI